MDEVVRSFFATMNKGGVAAFSAAATRTLRRSGFPSPDSPPPPYSTPPQNPPPPTAVRLVQLGLGPEIRARIKDLGVRGFRPRVGMRGCRRDAKESCRQKCGPSSLRKPAHRARVAMFGESNVILGSHKGLKTFRKAVLGQQVLAEERRDLAVHLQEHGAVEARRVVQQVGDEARAPGPEMRQPRAVAP